jgi:O-antigen/teichoic acid export membrane protein
MNLGRTSVVHFVSRFASSIIGFLATVYFANFLGPSKLGVYFLAVAVVSWLEIAGSVGVQSAVTKRLSEREDTAGILGAGAIAQAALFVIVAGLLLVLSGQVNSYVNGESVIRGFSATNLVVALLFANLGFTFISAVLHGQEAVALASVLRPVERIVRAGVQVGLVVLGYGVAGLLGGHALAVVLITLVGIAAARAEVRLPTREEVRSVLTYAKYSWLDVIRTRSFAWVDTIVLGFFVSSALIGIYEVAWNIASVLGIFSTSIVQTLFPRISAVASRDGVDRVRGLLDDALVYTGLFLIPGLAGAALVGDRILAIYGSEFVQGALVLVLLVGARTLYAYQAQFVNVINGIDRPAVAFRINAAFVGVNLALNAVLVFAFGWVGAAVATLLAAGVGTVLAYRWVDTELGVPIPAGELGRQVLAAGAMAGVVLPAERASPGGVAFTLALVSLGAVVYFLVLLGLSTRFRAKVAEHTPQLTG